MCTEDSPSGLWRTLGKRVGCKPSGVRIPHPPPPDPGTCPGSGVFFAFAAKSPHRRGGALLQRIRVFPLVVELEGKNRGTRYEISTNTVWRPVGELSCLCCLWRRWCSGRRSARASCETQSLAAVPVGGGRAWPGFEATRRAKLAARTTRGRAAAHGHTKQPGPTARPSGPSTPAALVVL